MPDHHRLAIVIDIADQPDQTITRIARTCLDHLHQHLTNHNITATPVRYDIDGWPHLAQPDRR